MSPASAASNQLAANKTHHYDHGWRGDAESSLITARYVFIFTSSHKHQQRLRDETPSQSPPHLMLLCSVPLERRLLLLRLRANKGGAVSEIQRHMHIE